MATVKLVASTYTRSNESYVVVSDEDYLYENTSNTAGYASVRGRGGRSSNSTYYCYLHGFNFGAVPSNATVTAFTVKIKGYRNSYQNTGSSYRVRLCGTATNSAISGTTCSSDWTTGTTGSVLTIPTGSLTWSDIVNYGSGFSIQLRLRNSSTTSSNYPYLYIYGAEIEVTYTLPATKYTVSASTSETDITVTHYPVRELDSGETAYVNIRGNLNDIVVYDNNVNVTSSLVYQDTASDTSPEAVDSYAYTILFVQADHTVVVSHSVAQTTYTVTTVNNAQSLSVSTSADNFNGVIGSGRGCLVYIDGSDFTDLYVEDNGTNVTSSLVYVPEETSGNETYPAYYYYYIGNISVNHTVTVYLGAPTPSTYTVSGTATDGLTLSAEYTLNNQSLYGALPITADTGSNVTVYIDGSDFTGFTLLNNNVDVTSQCSYTQPSQDYPTGYYAYVITNIQSAHTFTATLSSTSMPVRVKRNGTWVTAVKVFVKRSGSWVEGTVKVKNNGNWS